MPTEADTCRKFVVPFLQAAGWDNDPHSIAERRWFTQVDALPRLQAETAAELDALLPAILQSSLGFDAAGDRACKGEL